MAEFDRLPPELRGWLANAHLPWSAQSVQKLWAKALQRNQGRTQAALQFLTECETRLIEKDAPKIWSASYPKL